MCRYVYMKDQKVIFYITKPKTYGDPPIACSGTPNLCDKKAEPLRCIFGHFFVCTSHNYNMLQSTTLTTESLNATEYIKQYMCL